MNPSVASRGAHPIALRRAAPEDRIEVLDLLDTDPYVNASCRAKLQAMPASGWAEDVMLSEAEGRIIGGVCDGGNLHPFGSAGAWLPAAGAILAARKRRVSAVVGRRELIAELRPTLTPGWGAARAVRERQLLLVTDRVAPALVDPTVGVARLVDLETYLPAAVAMFTEELGQPPSAQVSQSSYRQGLAALIGAGRAVLLRDSAGRLAFKAEFAAVTPATCQIQGVWMRPDLRGRGLATTAMAGALWHALHLAPTVSLYVNDFNVPARRLYSGLGFTEVAELSTVLF